MPVSAAHNWARVLTLTAVAAMLLSGCSIIGDLANSGSGSTSTDGPKSDVFSVTVGDCLNDENSVGNDGTVTEVPIVDCAVSHDSEVIASQRIDEGDGTFPGDSAVKVDADRQCIAPFESFVGAALDTTALDYTYYFPSEESWGTGDREILCVAYDPAGRVEGTLKDQGPKYPKP